MPQTYGWLGMAGSQGMAECSQVADSHLRSDAAPRRELNLLVTRGVGKEHMVKIRILLRIPDSLLFQDFRSKVVGVLRLEVVEIGVLTDHPSDFRVRCQRPGVRLGVELFEAAQHIQRIAGLGSEIVFESPGETLQLSVGFVRIEIGRTAWGERV